FYSSRRRHTRSKRDWSSDVCSSDLGEDPNWGRVVAQVGTTSASFDPTAIDVTINGVQVCKASGPYEDPERVTFERSVDVVIDLHAGTDTATVWTSDLTHDYVEENSAYSS